MGVFIGIAIGIGVVILVAVIIANSENSANGVSGYKKVDLQDWEEISASKSSDEIFRKLIRRPGWRHVDEDILQQILGNAKGDLEKIIRFIMVSDAFGLVNHNYLKIQTRMSSVEMALSMYSTTLERLGSQQAELLYKSRNENEQSELYSNAQLAYESAILCDENILPAYGSLAYLHVMGGNFDAAKDWCSKGIKLANEIQRGSIPVTGGMWEGSSASIREMLLDLKKQIPNNPSQSHKNSPGKEAYNKTNNIDEDSNPIEKIEIGKPWTIPALGMALYPVMPGNFKMGSDSEQADDREKPVHTVHITKPFWMGKYQVTQSEYERLIGENPSRYDSKFNPVERVSWNNAVAYCKKLTEREKDLLPSGYEFRLPTEAEWEYAARGGHKSRKEYRYSGSDKIDSVAWHRSNNGRGTHPVGKLAPNELGLHDMSGNVEEWCLDWHDDDCYKRRTVEEDPCNNDNVENSRVKRGGCWYDLPRACRVANRDGQPPSTRSLTCGFRIVLAPESQVFTEKQKRKVTQEAEKRFAKENSEIREDKQDEAELEINERHKDRELEKHRKIQNEYAQKLTDIPPSVETGNCYICGYAEKLYLHTCINGAEVLLCPKHAYVKSQMNQSEFDEMLNLMDMAYREYSCNNCDEERFDRIIMQIATHPFFDDFDCHEFFTRQIQEKC